MERGGEEKQKVVSFVMRNRIIRDMVMMMMMVVMMMVMIIMMVMLIVITIKIMNVE